ncbi:MAG: hypothetical protein JSS22_03155 [Proteobacteria bacterium]|nr:hypothetical protein [Pseudomonadota bacterium]
MVVNAADFNASLSDVVPPPELSPPLAALWWAGKGGWDKAHAIAQDDATAEGSWVHAYLHRVEGDLGNASYWYRRAGKPVASNALDAEWTEIVATLLGSES